jgi:hypothetical protein
MATLIFRLRYIDYYPQEEWDIGSVLAKHRWLIKTLPIQSPEITKIDDWLMNQPDLYPDDIIDIWSRNLYCYWLAYRDPEVGQQTKHFMLLALKEEFEDFCRLSEFDQERAIQRSKSPPALNPPAVIEHDPSELKKPNARYRRF